MNIIEENRIGMFRLSRHLLRDSETSLLLAIFGKTVVVKTEYNYPADYIEYEAYSQMFEPCDRRCVPPYYRFNFTTELISDGDTESEKLITFTVEKIDKNNWYDSYYPIIGRVTRTHDETLYVEALR